LFIVTSFFLLLFFFCVCWKLYITAYEVYMNLLCSCVLYTYPVYGKGKLNWPSLPRSMIYIVVLLYKSLPRLSQFLLLKHIFLFSFLFQFLVNLLLLLLLAVFRFILNDIKYQLCYLKRCLYTQKFYLFIVTSFFMLRNWRLDGLKIVTRWQGD
jgi:hypothetical protein